MIIEVAGVSTWNKGAELMLVAICDHFKLNYPEVRLVVNQSFGSFTERAQYGLGLRVAPPKLSRSNLGIGLLPNQFRRKAGLYSLAEVDAVLDASGFAFSDQLDPRRITSFAKFVQFMRKAGKPLVMLPQALGPFDSAAHRSAFRSIVDAETLIYARDDQSYGFAMDASDGKGRIRMAPDFTNLVKPAPSPSKAASDRVCIVPNQRMIEKASSFESAAAYVPAMLMCIRTVEEAGLRPVVLVHGRHDGALADQIIHEHGKRLEVIDETDPVEIKRILSENRLVIGSRFHGLASALSQGVPCIATSWSHKYEMLFRDYGCEHMVLSLPVDVEKVRALVSEATGSKRAELVERITLKGVEQEKRVKEMWTEVEVEIELQHRRRAPEQVNAITAVV